MNAKARAGIQNRRKAHKKQGLDGIFLHPRCATSGRHVASGQHAAETDDVGMQHVAPTGVSDKSGLHLEIPSGGFVGQQKSAE